MVKSEKILLVGTLLVLTGIFNTLDYFLTLRALSMGYEEANPIVDKLLGTPWFPILKLLIVPCLLMLIWKLKGKVGKRLLLYVATGFTAYFFLMIYFGRIFLL